MTDFPIQDKFFDQLKKALPPNISIADELSDLLGISNDSAYRRMRGGTALSLDEAAIISRKYKISLDPVISSALDNEVTFSYTSLSNKIENFEKYLQRILEQLKMINQYDVKQITYSAEDIPMFYNFLYPELSAFKLYYWYKSILTVPEFEGKKFDFNIITKKNLELCHAIFNEYKKIPSIELWNEETISTTLKQVQFCIDTGLFVKKEDAIRVISQIKEMIQLVQKQAGLSSKTEEAIGQEKNFTLYSTEVMMSTNSILIGIGELKFAYLSFNTVNSMTTNNVYYCNEMEQWLNNMIKKSTLISGVAEKQRFQFFNTIYKRIDALMDAAGNYHH